MQVLKRIHRPIESSTSGGRLRSLDVFRGLTIAGMILVNSPGNETAFGWLEHSAWNGCTPTDLVFPFFVFMIGMSLVFSLNKKIDQGTPADDLFTPILKRSALIFGLGLFLNGFPYFHLATIRIPGVLQRIALCYFFAAILYLVVRTEVLVAMVLIFLLHYWMLMTHIVVPYYGAGNLSPEGNLASYIDQALFAGHMYRPYYDPEGFLSTGPAIATALMGVLASIWVRGSKTPKEKIYGLSIMAGFCIVAGWVWNITFPINKALWTSSFVLFTGGLALAVFALCYGLVELKKMDHWGRPFEIFGKNAIAAYVLHILFLKIQNLIHIARRDGTPGNLRFWITDHFFGWWATPKLASLCYALAYTALWYYVVRALDRRKIYLKV